jgi:hypothetical protein
MQRRLPVCLALPCAFLVSSCANTHLTQHPGLASSRPPASPSAPAAPAVSVVLYPRKLKFNAPATGFLGSHRSAYAMRGRLNTVLKEFPAFALEREGVSAPYRLVIEATQSIDGNKSLSTLCGMSKYLIPCREEHQIVMDAVLTRGGQSPKTYEATGSYRVRKHLLWLLVPFKWHRDVPSRTAMDAFRDILIQAERDVAP